MSAADIGALVVLAPLLVVLWGSAAILLVLLAVHFLGMIGIGKGAPWTKAKPRK